MTAPFAQFMEDVRAALIGAAEVRDRVRRMETRLTTYMEANGFETGAAKPVLKRVGDMHDIIVPSLGCTLVQVLRAIPGNEHVRITVKGETVGWITRERAYPLKETPHG